MPPVAFSGLVGPGGGVLTRTDWPAGDEPWEAAHFTRHRGFSHAADTDRTGAVVSILAEAELEVHPTLRVLASAFVHRPVDAGRNL